MKGDVILTHRKSLLGWLIRGVTKTYWDHAILDLGDNKYIESSWNGVNIIGPEFKNIEHVVYRHETATKSQLTNICNQAIKNVGSQYDYLQIVQLFFKFIFKFWNKGEIGRDNKFICSELIAKPFYDFNLPIIKYRHYSQIIPNDFTTSKYFKQSMVL